jgi:endonuclease/exonuclease/phosphatase family metal-dependent hydrolase
MNLRIATFNLENRKNWQRRRELIVEQLADLNPDILALNEIHIPEQTGRWLQSVARDRLEKNYCLLQQSKAGDESRQQAEGLAARVDLPGVPPRHLDERQAAIGERRKPAGPPLPDRSFMADTPEEVPDVPETECEEAPD